MLGFYRESYPDEGDPALVEAARVLSSVKRPVEPHARTSDDYALVSRAAAVASDPDTPPRWARAE